MYSSMSWSWKWTAEALAFIRETTSSALKY